MPDWNGWERRYKNLTYEEAVDLLLVEVPKIKKEVTSVLTKHFALELDTEFTNTPPDEDSVPTLVGSAVPYALWVPVEIIDGWNWLELGAYPAPGGQGEPGAPGGAPTPVWNGTSLFFIMPDGTQTTKIDLRGLPGTLPRFGAAAPTITVGVQANEMYFNLNSGDIFTFNGIQWVLGGNIKGAPGNDGATPEIVNGYWWIRNKNTGVKAAGMDGKDAVPLIFQDPTVYDASLLPEFSRVTVNYAWFVVIGGVTFIYAKLINGSDWTIVPLSGQAGKDGVGFVSAAIAYQISASGTKAPTGSWSSTVPALTQGQFLWTRVIVTYTDSSTSVIYFPAYQGKDGRDGYSSSGGSQLLWKGFLDMEIEESVWYEWEENDTENPFADIPNYKDWDDAPKITLQLAEGGWYGTTFYVTVPITPTGWEAQLVTVNYTFTNGGFLQFDIGIMSDRYMGIGNSALIIDNVHFAIDETRLEVARIFLYGVFLDNKGAWEN